MLKHLSLASIVAVVASGAGPIAPECAESFCAQVDASASLDCYDPISDAKFTMSMAVRGRTTEVTCAIDAPPPGVGRTSSSARGQRTRPTRT